MKDTSTISGAVENFIKLNFVIYKMLNINTTGNFFFSSGVIDLVASFDILPSECA